MTILAAADCAASVLSAGILAAVWEWDRNGNGIDDALEAQFIQGRVQRAFYVPATETAKVRPNMEPRAEDEGPKS